MMAIDMVGTGLPLTSALADAGLRTLPVLAGAWFISAVWRSASAATRHALWVVAIAVTLALPLCMLALPHWRVPVLPRATGTERLPVVASPSPPLSRLPGQLASRSASPEGGAGSGYHRAALQRESVNGSGTIAVGRSAGGLPTPPSAAGAAWSSDGD
jgi:hypothetical protein